MALVKTLLNYSYYNRLWQYRGMAFIPITKRAMTLGVMYGQYNIFRGLGPRCFVLSITASCARLRY